MAEVLDTVRLNALAAGWRAGDRAAADVLVRSTHGRLEVLARRMLGRFPNVRGLADTGDVLQGGLVRLLAALRRLDPPTTRDFFNLAAAHLRRELLDLARRAGCRPDAARRRRADTPPDPLGRLADPDPGADDLDRWCRFHGAVGGLPPDEREVFGLAFYHGLTHDRIAELLGVTDRTVRRRWQAACLRLNDRLEGDFPVG
ncbi:MAG: sigma-70 family RNA polymerase sigma factor [Isosphaera sp.]|nr:sigma-70 family RNA polymerase sigma factor [Isosphaera sp.]